MLSRSIKIFLIIICTLSVSVAGFWLISKTFAFIGPSANPPSGDGVFKAIPVDGGGVGLKIGNGVESITDTRLLIHNQESNLVDLKIYNPKAIDRQNIFVVNGASGVSVGTTTVPAVFLGGNPKYRPGSCSNTVGETGSNCPLMYIGGKLISETIGTYNINASGTVTSDGGFVGNLIGGVSAGGVSSGVFGSLVGGGNYYFPSSVGIRSSSTLPEFQLDLDGDATNSGIISRGTYLSGDTLSTSGAGTRLIWYPRKAAFRAGFITGTQWNDANIGDYSVALGYDTIASGNFGSTAIGSTATASGIFGSTAIGEHVTASGKAGATAIGYYNTASGESGATAIGANNTASGNYGAVALGYYTNATATSSLALGISVRAASYNSIVLGSGCRTDDFTYPCTLWNSAPESLYVGFNSNIPTLVVTRSNGSSTTGNVGISKTSPTYKLDVGGDVNITGNYRVNGAILTSGVTGSGVNNTLAKWGASGTTLTTSTITDNNGAIVIGSTGSVTIGNAGNYIYVNGLVLSDIKFAQSSAYAISGGDGKAGMVNGFNLTIRGGNGLGAGNSGGDLFLAGGTGVAQIPGDILMQSSTNPGNVGIGKNPTYKLDVAGDVNITGTYRVNGTAIGAIAGSGTANNVVKWTGTTSIGNSIMTENATGVGIGTNPATDKLQVFGNIRIGVSVANAGCLINFGGGVIAGTCSSDQKLKKNITYLDNVLGKVSSLKPATFEWRVEDYPEMGFGPGINYGLVAQDVEKIFPELVVTDTKGFKAIKYQDLPMLTLEAIKEQQKVITGLENRINLLESKIK